ncbi:unnamed protein product [Boreogadus saida]
MGCVGRRAGPPAPLSALLVTDNHHMERAVPRRVFALWSLKSGRRMLCCYAPQPMLLRQHSAKCSGETGENME